jgi:predicted N-acetyltransferase YhbS
MVMVRTLERGDAAAVAELIVQLGYRRSVADVLAWTESVRPESQAAFVACVGEQVVGWIEVSLERRLQTPPFVLIGGLVVAEGMRGAGIGRKLCEQAERWCVAQGASTVRVTSRSTREAAHRFYLRDGYGLVKTSLVFEKRAGETKRGE